MIFVEANGKRMQEAIREAKRVLAPIQGAGIVGWVAGGFLRSILTGDPRRDVDLFFQDEEGFERARKLYEQTAYLQYETDHCVAFEHFSSPNTLDLVELVKSHYAQDLPTLLEGFDFTMCQVGWDGVSEGLWMGEDTLHDLAVKNLRVYSAGMLQSWRAMDTLRRVEKYANLGYTMDTENRDLVYRHIQAGPQSVMAHEVNRDPRASA